MKKFAFILTIVFVSLHEAQSKSVGHETQFGPVGNGKRNGQSTQSGPVGNGKSENQMTQSGPVENGKSEGTSCDDIDDRSQVIEVAKKAKKESKYENMKDCMQKAIKLSGKLNNVEKDMFRDAYQNLIAPLEKKIKDGSEDITEVRERLRQVKEELVDTVRGVLLPSVNYDIAEIYGTAKTALQEKELLAHSYVGMINIHMQYDAHDAYDAWHKSYRRTPSYLSRNNAKEEMCKSLDYCMAL